MVHDYSYQKNLMHARLDLKTNEIMLENLIHYGTNCSAFEASVIVDKAKEVFSIGEYNDKKVLQPGQLVWTAVDSKEPPGKPLKNCRMQKIYLSYHCAEDDDVYRKFGLAAKRQQQILRVCDEAKEQNALLTQEDLSKLLGVDIKTVRKDIAALKKEGMVVPTRGQQKDIGPGVTHREIAVRMFLKGSEPLEVSRNIKHSLKAVERYIDAFCRVVFCQAQVHNTLQTALIIGISVSQVNSYLDIKEEYFKKPEYQKRIDMIEKKGKSYWEQIDFKKNALQQERRQK